MLQSCGVIGGHGLSAITNGGDGGVNHQYLGILL